jgi:hypothetical protein
MKTLKSIFALVITSLFVVAIVISFPGCSKETPMQPQLTADPDLVDLTGKPIKETVIDPEPATNTDYPQYGEATCRYAKNYGEYFGILLKTPNNSNFWVDNWSLTPPEVTRTGAAVTITMEIDISPDGNELVFTFGPSGCKFSPAARVIMDYSDLVFGESDSAPDLFLVDEQGNYIAEDPQNYEVDTLNKWIYLYIPHFSRYSLIRR